MKTNLDKHGFQHLFNPGDPSLPPLLLLHGTGGNECDLIPLARQLSPGASLLSVRGKVTERGMARFFRRFAEGVFDQEDIRHRTDELLQFLEEAIEAYDIAKGRLVILGYSNGANIGTNLLFTKPESFAGGIHMRPMVIRELEPPLPDLSGKRVLLLAGAQDPIAGPKEVNALESQFKSTGASVTTVIHPAASHSLTQGDLASSAAFLKGFED